MVSPKLPNVQPQLPMAEDKKTIANFFKKPFQSLFQKQKKTKLKEKKHEKEEIKPTEKIATPVSVILEKFDQLEIQKKEPVKEEEDEFENFSYKVIEDDSRTARIDSHSSEDSGFTECSVNDSDEEKDDKAIVESLAKLKVDDKKENDDKGGKKLQTVVITRGLEKTKKSFGKSVHPYAQDYAESVYRQANKQTLTGGQVIVNVNTRSENCSEIDLALKQIELNVKKFTQNTQQEQVDSWNLAQEFISDSSRNLDDILSGFNVEETQNNLHIPAHMKSPTPNPIEKFSTSNHTYDYDIELPVIDGFKTSIYPTPPRSENVPSPMSDSQTFYPPSSDYTLSPDTLSPSYLSDYEKCQDITPLDEYPTCIIDNVDSDKDCADKKRKSSMTMKQFKDLQREIAGNYSKMECCQINRRSCKEIFTEYLHKLKVEERKNLCYNVASMDLKTCYGVLHHALKNLSNDKDENINMVLFSLICEKVLAQKPLLFVGDFGLSILIAAVLRCSTRPLLTRYIVQCIRTVTKSESYKPTRDYVFSEVDALGDNLVIACARAGDECASVLAELVRNDGDIPLFNVHHANTNGHTALHVCCGEHSARAPRAHALHALLKHGRADLWRGDIKGGDTPLHLAVNSANCDLSIIMILFQHIDRKEWRKLAHVHNRSSVNPLEYARSATKSGTRQNYPVEVLDFLKKCR